MTVPRGLLVLGMMVVIGVAVVAIRMESAKAAYRVQRLHQQKVALEQKLWSQEIDLARLRSPDEIRRRARELGLEVVPPLAEPAAQKDQGKSTRD